MLGAILALAAQLFWGWYEPIGTTSTPVDPREVGLGLGWLIFGGCAQAIFMGRFLVQWIASEVKGRSTVPTAFWVFSLAGGLSLFLYFGRRGDPIGMAGQSFGVFVYLRNLWLILRHKLCAEGGEDGVASDEVPADPVPLSEGDT